jgi:hypothetical protein
MAELRQSVRTKIGLPAEIDFYTLFEVFGPKMEREMQPKENVCDIIFKWEKFATPPALMSQICRNIKEHRDAADDF